MNTRFDVVLCSLVASVAACAGTSHAQLDDFLVVTANGHLNMIDGDTLEATSAGQLEMRSPSEILYVGNNEVLVSTLGGFVRYNLDTGEENIEFITSDILPNPALIDWTESAAFTAQRNVYFGVTAWTTEGNHRYGMLYNPHTGSFTEMSVHQAPADGLYFDYIEIENHIFLASDLSGGSILTVNAETGETLADFPVSLEIASFMTVGNTVYAFTTQGAMYLFDTTDGSLDLYGNITGLPDYLIGATSLSVPQTVDINYDGARDFFDMTDFVNSFQSREPIADWNDDGNFDFFDISGFISDFDSSD